MTEPDILQMSPGLEMDIMICEKVMGWEGKRTAYYWSDRKAKAHPELIFSSRPDNWEVYGNDFRIMNTMVTEDETKVWGQYIPANFSCNERFVGAIIKVLHDNEVPVWLRNGSQPESQEPCWVVTVSQYEVVAKTLPEALCKAALCWAEGRQQ